VRLAEATPFDERTLDFASECFLAVTDILAEHGSKPDDEIMDETAMAVLLKASQRRR
jgi:hypothetical protein